MVFIYKDQIMLLIKMGKKSYFFMLLLGYGWLI